MASLTSEILAHASGMPGRREIDRAQELYYPAIMNCVVETVFNGFVAQEFVPLKDPVASHIAAVRCDVLIISTRCAK